MSLFVNTTANVLYFIHFLLPARAFCVSWGLVVLITPYPLSAVNPNRLRGVSDVGAWNEKWGRG